MLYQSMDAVPKHAAYSLFTVVNKVYVQQELTMKKHQK